MGAEVDGGVIKADAVVIAMGPWSLTAAEWMVLPPVFGRRSPSLVYDTGMEIPAEALFLEYHDESERRGDGRSISEGQRKHPYHGLL